MLKNGECAHVGTVDAQDIANALPHVTLVNAHELLEGGQQKADRIFLGNRMSCGRQQVRQNIDKLGAQCDSFFCEQRVFSDEKFEF